ncbi:hypothetical protein B0H13DRAFT_450262 [Mycena leptocephala]|nr:hypothetical protein B0H13DRAFT_450262 [Mycena leptocephala]
MINRSSKLAPTHKFSPHPAHHLPASPVSAFHPEMTATLQLPDTSLSILASDLPDSSTTKFMIVVFVVAAIAPALIYYSSPMRLTRVLVAAITATEKTYIEAVETGLLSTSSVDTAATLSTLQSKVSKIREATLRNSCSNWKAFCGFFKGRVFTILLCIREVRDLETHIEILKETRLCESNLDPLSMRAISLRRRCTS